MEKPYDKYLLLFALGVIAGISMKSCSDNAETPYKVTEPAVKEIEKETVYLKGEVITLKHIVEKEDKRRVDSLTNKLDSILALENFDKDTALNVCLDVVENQEIVIKRQDTIIVKQENIIYNDSIVKQVLNQEIITQKKKARKNMFKGIGIGFVGGILTGILWKNS